MKNTTDVIWTIITQKMRLALEFEVNVLEFEANVSK